MKKTQVGSSITVACLYYLLGPDDYDRLGGMLYCRLVGPARFLEWMMIDAFRNTNLSQC